MTSTVQPCRKKKRTKTLPLIAVVFVVAAVWEFGYVFEFEYPFWPTLWLAEQTRTPDGSRVTDLVRTRSGSSYAEQHWHHCTWCDVVYPHAPHMAVKVYINTNENDFYLFDWDGWHRKLLPLTVRTAKLVPELIPARSVVELVGDGGNPQLYQNDEPCLVVAQSSKR